MKVISNNRPLFALVCGFEHSGTTLISEILRQHPQLDSGFEGGFLLNNEAKEFLKTEPFYTNSKKGWGLKEEDLSYICDANTWADVYLRLRERSTVIQDKEALVFDKTPRYMQKLPDVLKRVPDVYCIVIVKDIRSVFWSSYKRAKMTMDEWHKTMFKRTCNHTLSYASGWKNAINEGFENRILLIKYEELCLQPETEVKKIFNFLNLEYQKSYLNIENPRYQNVYAEFYLLDMVENRIPFEKVTYCRGFEYLCQLIFSKSGTNEATAKIIKDICLRDIELHGKQPWSSLYLGAALKVSGQLEEAYQHFQNAADSVSLLNHAGQGCFSCRTYSILEDRSSHLSSSLWMSELISPITFHHQDGRFENSKLVLLICSDSNYFKTFSEIFSKSCLLQDSDVACHFHIVNPESVTFEYYSKLKSLFPNLPLAISSEKIDIVNLKTYYSMVRFVRINEFLNHYNKSILIMDADAVLTGNVSSLTTTLNQFDICLSLKNNDNYFPWRSIPADAVFASSSQLCKLFFDQVCHYLNLVFEPNENGSFWWIDQNSLFAAYEYCKNYHPSLKVGNIENIGVKSVMAFAPNDSKKKEKFIENHQAKLDKLEKFAHNHVQELELVSAEYGQFYGFKGDSITEQLKQFGAHCRNELAMLLSLINEGDSIIDVGAHIGTFAIPFGKKVGSSGKVYAFEGNSDNYSNLAKNIEINYLNNIVNMQYGIVTDQPGKYTLKKSILGNSGTYYFELEGTKYEAKQDTACICIDQWYQYQNINRLINLIKIDTEGFEFNVLKSAKNLIGFQKPIIYAEINRASLSRLGQKVEDIEKFLKELGYHFFKNGGKRNSNTDEYIIVPLENINQGGAFYDLLAIHPDSDRYPNQISVDTPPQLK